MGGDDRRLSTIARVARPVALTLGGGAALTLLSAAPSFAGTGDATATGNQSGTQAGQTLTMKDGGYVTMDAGVDNNGLGGSNSGANASAGNTDANDDSDSVTGKNNADAIGNDSDGTSRIDTGSATSGGNQSQTRLGQAATTNGGENLIVLQQGAFVLNSGLGLANTGLNDNFITGSGVTTTGNAWGLGNWADNDVQQAADLTSGVSLLVVQQLADVSNEGAGISNTGINAGDVTTGNATSTGNHSTQNAAQGTIADGDNLAAAVVQSATRQRQRGLAVANSGVNFGSVDESSDDDSLDQDPDEYTVGGVPISELFPF